MRIDGKSERERESGVFRLAPSSLMLLDSFSPWVWVVHSGSRTGPMSGAAAFFEETLSSFATNGFWRMAATFLSEAMHAPGSNGWLEESFLGVVCGGSRISSGTCGKVSSHAWNAQPIGPLSPGRR